MMIVLVYLPSDYRPQVHSFDDPPSRQALRDLVEGDIEPVPGFNIIAHGRAFYPCVAFRDKRGKRHQLPTNNWATALWHSALMRQGGKGLRQPDGTISDWLVGNVAIVYREEDARTDAGKRVDLQPETLEPSPLAAG
jgi:hypothetical protein